MSNAGDTVDGIQMSICTECKHEEMHWTKMCSQDSSCRATHVRNPVTGRGYNTELCKNKNRDGKCKDFEPKELNLCGCLVILAVMGGLFLWWVLA